MEGVVVSEDTELVVAVVAEEEVDSTEMEKTLRASQLSRRMVRLVEAREAVEGSEVVEVVQEVVASEVREVPSEEAEADQLLLTIAKVKERGSSTRLQLARARPLRMLNQLRRQPSESQSDPCHSIT